MHFFRKAGIALLAAALMIVAVVPLQAQDEVPVLVYPIDRASFLPGALFDLQVEVHAEELPENFAVTINGEPVGEFFGVEAESLSWTFGDEENPTPSQATSWRAISFEEAGEYTVEVTAGDTVAAVTYDVREPGNEGARNVILFIADGGSTAVYTAARLVSRGMTQGFYNDRLVFEKFPVIGQLSTSGTDSIMTDSANSASAYNTGHKSAVNGTGVYANTSRGEFDQQFDDAWVETLAEIITRTRDMGTGAISTRYIQDATPAALWGHSRERNNPARADFVLQAIGQGKTGERGWTNPDMDVLLGGGSRFFIPQSIDGSARSDEVDAVTLYEEAGYTLVTTATELEEAMADTPEKLVGLFTPGDYPYWLDRNVYTENIADFPDQPGLVDMTMAALDVLSQNENGFYLMVEAGAIDRALHPMDFERAIADTIEFERAIAATMDYLEENGMLEDTLVVVTSDHAHSFDVWGVVDVEQFNAAEDDLGRRAAIGVYGNAGFPTYVDEDGDFFPDSWDVSRTLAWGKVENPEYTEDFQVSTVPRSPTIRNEDGIAVDNPEDDPNGIFQASIQGPGDTSTVHTLQDVPIYATGPGSEYFGRAMENVDVFFGIAAAIGLDPRAEDGMAMMNVSEATELANTGVTYDLNGFNATGILLLLVGLGFGVVFEAARRRRAA